MCFGEDLPCNTQPRSWKALCRPCLYQLDGQSSQFHLFSSLFNNRQQVCHLVWIS